MKKVAKILVIVVAAVALFGAVVMLLWNALIPDLFNGPIITFWQAIGLLILSHILIRSWGGHHGWKHDRWKHKLEEKLATMSPEEREKFKEEYRRRCGWMPDDKKEM